MTCVVGKPGFSFGVPCDETSAVCVLCYKLERDRPPCGGGAPSELGRAERVTSPLLFSAGSPESSFHWVVVRPGARSIPTELIQLWLSLGMVEC